MQLVQCLVQRVPRVAGHDGGGAGWASARLRLGNCCYKDGFNAAMVVAVLAVVMVVQGIRQGSVAGSIRLRAR